MEKHERRFIYELRNVQSGEYLADMHQWFSEDCSREGYSVGDEIPIPDAILNRNNCWKLRSCIVERAESCEVFADFILYLRVGEKEIKPFGAINWEKARKFFNRAVDWSGSDGWLKFD